jgi:hypothetical protein
MISPRLILVEDRPAAQTTTVIVRLDRTIQYPEAVVVACRLTTAAAYWVPRLR